MIRTETRFTLEVVIDSEHAHLDIGSRWESGRPTKHVLQIVGDTKEDVVRQLSSMRDDLETALVEME